VEASPTPPAAPPPAPAGDEQAQTGARIAAGIGALVLLFIALVAVLVVVDVGGTTPCEDVTSIADLNDDGECYDRSPAVKVFVLIIGSLGALASLAAAGLALGYAIRGRGGRLLLQAIGAAVVLLALTMIIG
jgi:hypothetical protein